MRLFSDNLVSTRPRVSDETWDRIVKLVGDEGAADRIRRLLDLAGKPPARVHDYRADLLSQRYALQDMINQCPEDAVIDRMSLEHRLKQGNEKIARLERESCA